MFFADTEPDRTCNLFHRSLAFELRKKTPKSTKRKTTTSTTTTITTTQGCFATSKYAENNNKVGPGHNLPSWKQDFCCFCSKTQNDRKHTQTLKLEDDISKLWKPYRKSSRQLICEFHTAFWVGDAGKRNTLLYISIFSSAMYRYSLHRIGILLYINR